MVTGAASDLRTHAERLGHARHDAIDGPPLLGAAGEVDAAHDGRVLVDAAIEQAGDQIDEPLAQRIELPRESVDPIAGLEAPLLAHPRDRVALERVGQIVEVLRERLDVVVVFAGHRQRESPDLPPLAILQIAEGLDEPREEIALRDHQVDGDDHVEPARHLVDPLAQRPRQIADLLDVAGQVRRRRRRPGCR